MADHEYQCLAVGEFDCTIVNDGAYAYLQPGQFFFENVPHDLLAAALASHGIDLDKWETYVCFYPSLVVQTPDNLILVDTGMGSLAPTTGRLATNLQTAGLHLRDVDTVILTHVHPEHVGGNLDEAGNLLCPNARWVMWRTEWEFWTLAPDLSALRNDRFKEMMLTAACTRLPPIEPLLDLVEPEQEIVPGVKAVAAPGHTPGHMALLISSGDDKLLALADALLHPVHVEQPDWATPLDLLVDETVVTRRRLLGLAAVENALVFAPHFAFPGLGRVVLANQGWRWQPIISACASTQNT